MTVSLKQKITEQLPWLFEELGFKILEDSYDPESFGDSLVVLQSAALRIRFVRDKGQIFMELASLSAPEKWRYLGQICELKSL